MPRLSIAKMLALGILGGSEIAFSPSNITGGMAWYDFSDITKLFQDAARTTPVTADGDPIGGVADKFGGSGHASQTTSTKRAIYKTNIKNGLSAALFDGIDDFLQNAIAGSANGLTVYMVVNRTPTTNKYIADGITANTPAIISGFSSKSFQFYATTAFDFSALATGAHILSFKGNDSNLTGRFDGTQVSSTNSPVTNLVGKCLRWIGSASGGSSNFDSYVYEVLMYDDYHPDALMQQFEQHLGAKWAIPNP